MVTRNSTDGQSWCDARPFRRDLNVGEFVGGDQMHGKCGAARHVCRNRAEVRLPQFVALRGSCGCDTRPLASADDRTKFSAERFGQEIEAIASAREPMRRIVGGAD